MPVRSYDDPDLAFRDGDAEHRVYLLDRDEWLGRKERGRSPREAPVVAVRVTEGGRHRLQAFPLRDRMTCGWLTRLICDGQKRAPLVATDDELLGADRKPDKEAM